MLDPGESAEVPVSVFGIGLGILTDMPTITVNATCAEGSTANATANAKILLILVII
jgi:acetyl-CoA acetyltransferase